LVMMIFHHHFNLFFPQYFKLMEHIQKMFLIRGRMNGD
jgi:hypothetical protein